MIQQQMGQQAHLRGVHSQMPQQQQQQQQREREKRDREEQHMRKLVSAATYRRSSRDAFLIHVATRRAEARLLFRFRVLI